MATKNRKSPKKAQRLPVLAIPLTEAEMEYVMKIKPAHIRSAAAWGRELVLAQAKALRAKAGFAGAVGS